MESFTSTNTSGITQTICHVRAIRYSLPTLSCDCCGQPAPRFSTVARTAIDLDLEQPTLLHVTVSIHHCRACHHYFRAQPPFLRADAIYTNRVVTKAIQTVHHDGMAFRRTAARLARDFWVRPSEGSIRRWCRAYGTAVDLDADYQPWVVQSFSGVLCVDEVYQGQLALLLAVDPVAPDGDRLIGYQLVTGSVQQTDVEPFLTRLRAAGIAPEQIVTDGSQLYPTLLKQIWPTAVHQLCLFHETRRVTQAVQEVYRDVRATIPKPPRAWTRPPAPPTTSRPRPPDFRGRPRSIPPAPDATDPESAYWRARQAARQAAITQVQRLHQRGYSIRSIARQTGFARQTVDAWLQESVAHAAEQPTAPAPAMPLSGREPAGPSQLTGDLPSRLDLRGRPRAHQEAVESTDPAAHQWHMRQAARQAGIAQAHQLHRNGVSVRAIARQLHIARQTVDTWLHLPDPAETDPATGDAPDPPSTSSDTSAARHDPCLSSSVPLTIPPPPAPWTSWEQVRQTRETLTDQHGLLLRRPDHLTSTDQAQLDTLLTSPAGVLLRVARAFVVDWYAIWRDERGARRSLADAQVRYEQWRTHPDYQAIPALHKVQTAVEQARFVQLSHFLKHPTWESTNNGAERGGRLFRQLQGPHFNLRTRDAIDAALKAHLQIAKELRTQASEPPPCRCGRGRKPGHVRRIVSA